MSVAAIKTGVEQLLANKRGDEEELRLEVIRQRQIGTASDIELARRRWLLASGVVNEVETAARAAGNLV